MSEKHYQSGKSIMDDLVAQNSVPKANTLSRQGILETAIKLTTGSRAESYGDFGEQMRSLATAFNGITGRDLTSKEVGVMLVLLKLRRAQTTSGGDQDSYVDGAAYFALLGEYFSG